MANYVVSRSLLLVATNQTTLLMELDPIPTGDATDGKGVLNVMSLTAPAGNTASLEVFIDSSMDGITWESAGGASTIATAAGVSTFTFTPKSEWFRIRYALKPDATGTGTGAAVALLDLKIRTYRS